MTLTTSIRGYWFHFIDVETEAQRGCIILSKVTQQVNDGTHTRMEPMSVDLKSQALLTMPPKYKRLFFQPVKELRGRHKPPAPLQRASQAACSHSGSPVQGRWLPSLTFNRGSRNIFAVGLGISRKQN